MKKIIIFTSSGGGGHMAATDALKQYLAHDYDIQESYIFRDVLSSLDFVRIISCGTYSDEDFFNYLVQKKRIWLITQLYSLGSWYINKLQRKKINAILTSYIIAQKPSLIISVVPLINRSILDVTEKLSIPFFIIPTDLDISGYLIDIHKPTYKNFFITAAFNEPTITDPLRTAHILPENILNIGFLLRSDFFEQKNRIAIKKNYAIPEHKPIITLLLGSRGNHEITTFVQHLAAITIPIHILALVGTNETEKNKLTHVTLDNHISMHIIEFTTRVSDLLSVTDLFITKTGPNSICEALYTNIPCVLDVTSPVLPWEQCTISFIHKHRYGKSITSHNEIASVVENLLINQTELEEYKTNIQKMEKRIQEISSKHI